MTRQEAEIYLKTCYESCVRTETHPVSLEWHHNKYAHSLGVAALIEDMMGQEKELAAFSKDIKEKLYIAAVLHDIYRFSQMKNGILDTSVKHGEEGRRLLQTKTDDLFLLLWVAHHDDTRAEDIQNDADFQKCSPIQQDILLKGLHALRDADLLENSQNMMKPSFSFAYKGHFKPEIQDEIIHAIVSKRRYNGIQYLVTAYDTCASRFCWAFAYHYDFARKKHQMLNVNACLFKHIEKLKPYSESAGFHDFEKLNRQVQIIRKSVMPENV